MADTFDWMTEFKNAFGDEADQKTPWIKLENNVPFTGKVKFIAGAKTSNFGTDIIEIWFHDDDLTERHLDAGKALAKSLATHDIQAGDTITITKRADAAKAKDGTQVFQVDAEGNTVKDEAGNPIPQSYTRYHIDIVSKGTPSEEGEKKAAAGKAKPDSEEVDISDIPF